mmetsp:Transcript_53930/g.148716  ORF Transcript_53930/g.148716 Transcript_53930/m.148716 type:complete len:255 (-) Transcript_53930:1-765(-)
MMQAAAGSRPAGLRVGPKLGSAVIEDGLLAARAHVLLLMHAHILGRHVHRLPVPAVSAARLLLPVRLELHDALCALLGRVLHCWRRLLLRRRLLCRWLLDDRHVRRLLDRRHVRWQLVHWRRLVRWRLLLCRRLFFVVKPCAQALLHGRRSGDDVRSVGEDTGDRLRQRLPLSWVPCAACPQHSRCLQKVWPACDDGEYATSLVVRNLEMGLQLRAQPGAWLVVGVQPRRFRHRADDHASREAGCRHRSSCRAP